MIIRKIILSIFLILILTGCARKTGAVSGAQTAAIKNATTPRPNTEDPQATLTATHTLRPPQRVTLTTTPSKTEEATKPAPLATPAETQSLEDLRAEFVDLITEYLERGGGSNEVQSVRKIGFSEGGYFDIELETLWPSKELQPSVAFEVIYWLGKAWERSPRELFYRLSGQNRFVVRLVTYSSEGKFPYESETNLLTVQKVGERAITYEEWLAASNAGFR